MSVWTKKKETEFFWARFVKRILKRLMIRWIGVFFIGFWRRKVKKKGLGENGFSGIRVD